MSLQGEVNDHGTGDVQNDEIEVELDDFYFGPTFVRGAPGETVTVYLTNEGDRATRSPAMRSVRTKRRNRVTRRR